MESRNMNDRLRPTPTQQTQLPVGTRRVGPKSPLAARSDPKAKPKIHKNRQKQHPPPPPTFGDESFQIPSREFHSREDNFRPVGEAVEERSNGNKKTATGSNAPAPTPTRQNSGEPPAPHATPDADPDPADAAETRLSDEEPPVPGSARDYFNRMGREFIAFDNLRRIDAELFEELKTIEGQLRQSLESNETEGDEDLRTAIRELESRLDNYDERIRNYREIEIRGPWDITANLRKSIEEVREKLEQMDGIFVSGKVKGLQDSKGKMASWLREVMIGITTSHKATEDILAQYQQSLELEFTAQKELLASVNQRVEDLGRREHVTSDDIRALTISIKEFDKSSGSFRSEFGKLLKEKIEAVVNFDPVNLKLEGLQGELKEMHRMLDDVDALNIKDEMAKFNSRPLIDADGFKQMHDKIDSLEARSDLEPAMQKIRESLEVLEGRPDVTEEVKKGLKTVTDRVEQVKNQQSQPFEEIKQAVHHIEEVMKEVKDRPSQDYTENLGHLNAMLDDAKVRLDEEKAKLEEIQGSLEELKSRPQLDETSALNNIEKSLDTLTNRPRIDYAPALKSISQSLTQGLEDAKVNLDEKLGEKVDDIKGHVDGTLKETSAHLEEQYKEGSGDIKTHLDTELKDSTKDIKTHVDIKLKESSEGIKTHFDTKIKDNSDELKNHFDGKVKETNTRLGQLDGQMDDIRGRPALNTDFTQLASAIQSLTEAVGEHDSGTVVGHLQDLAKTLREQPSLNINRDDLFNALHHVESMIEHTPSVNGQAILDRIQGVEEAVKAIDTPGLFHDINDLRSRPLGISKDDFTTGIQGVHNNIDGLKKNPVIAANAPLLTQDHFDSQMVPFIDGNTQLIESDQRQHEQQRAIWDTVRNVHSGMEDLKMRPVVDHGPVLSMGKQLQVWQDASQRIQKGVSSKLDHILEDHASFGNQVKDMRQEVKQGLATNRQQDDAKLEVMSKKLDGVTKIATGAAIASGLTLAAYFGWKAIKGLFGKKKAKTEKTEKTKRQLDDSQNVPSRLHARSWDINPDALDIPLSFNGIHLSDSSLIQLVEMNEEDLEGFLEFLMELEGPGDVCDV
jgi:hypothetical protein